MIKRDIYADGCQFSSKVHLWEAISAAARAVPQSTIRKLPNSMTTRLFDIKLHGAHVGN